MKLLVKKKFNPNGSTLSKEDQRIKKGKSVVYKKVVYFSY